MAKKENKEASPLRRWWKSPRIRNARKRISNIQVLLYPLLGITVRTWFWCVRKFVRYERRGPFYDYLREGKPFVMAVWHEDAMPAAMEIFRYTHDHKTVVMASPGRTGRLAAYAFQLFGVEIIYGSNSVRGIEAIEEISDMVNDEGPSVIIAGDGSRGPSRVAGWGGVYLAKNTGFPLIGARGWTEHRIILKNTWMKMALPIPWGKGVFLSTEPIYVPKNSTKEDLRGYRELLEKRMNAQADASVAYFEEGPESIEAWPRSNFTPEP